MLFFTDFARFFAQFLRDLAECDIMAVAGFLETRPPPADFRLTSGLFVFEMAKGVELVFGCWRSGLATLKFNLARSGFPACQCLSKKVYVNTELSYLAEYH